MINSSIRKQALVGWFCNNTRIFSNMQLQKFLFFYECFSKIDGDIEDILKKYSNAFKEEELVKLNYCLKKSHEVLDPILRMLSCCGKKSGIDFHVSPLTICKL
jgi:hypothetical protein